MKQITLPHRVCDYTCMVNGLEDLYEQASGQRLPEMFLFFMSGMAGFAYVKNKRAPIPRFVGWSVRVKEQYQFLAQVIGYEWWTLEGRSFATALQRVRTSLEAQTPVIVGALDMYHLPFYPKFYHHYHVPYHYVLIVGYDDDRQICLVHDCGRPEVQELSYADLAQAWEAKPGLSERNTLFGFQLPAEVPGLAVMAERGLRLKTEHMLRPPVRLFGLPGLQRLAEDLPGWPDELDAPALNASLLSLAEFTGSPPMLPARLMGKTDAPNVHAGARDGFARLLDQLALDLNRPAWAEAAACFGRSGQKIEAFTDLIVDTLQGDVIQAQASCLEAAAGLLREVIALEVAGYGALDKSLP